MPNEIERKFLPKSGAWRTAQPLTSTKIIQGYLTSDPGCTVRVRYGSDRFGKYGFITVKGKTEGISRPEFEYPIPSQHALHMLSAFAAQTITKTRHTALVDGVTFEIDEFHGENEGLVVIEVELESEDQKFPTPVWLGEEVSHDVRYFNSNLLTNPFTKWEERWHALGDEDAQ
jgi:adenylate cyclase